MAKAIGPNFPNELAEAALPSVAFTWSSDGSFVFDPAMTAPQIAAVHAVYAAHDPTKPDPNAAAAALMSAGFTITSTGTPALNGTYGCSQRDEDRITSLQVAVGAGVFPGFLRDTAGVAHAMTAAQFTAIAEVLLAFVVAVDQAKAAALAGGAWVAPAAAATIA